MDSLIRTLGPADLYELVRLNNAAVPAVPQSTEADIARLVELAAVAVAAVSADEPNRVLGFMIAIEPGRPYDSENYLWFEARGIDHLYVDRLVVAEDARGAGVGRLLYAQVFEAARAAGRAEVTCEVNVQPPNPGSMLFHERLGFTEVGRQETKGGSVVVALLTAGVRD
ncbi:MAG: GNAT family N-acetyltransferase [Microbacteriaceae bacterium]